MRARPVTDWRPDIFEYLDYRAYLRDAYAAGKDNVSAFSYRYLARRAGFSSPNFIKLVMEGKRNLGGDSPERVAGAFDLGEDETRFFLALVAFDQADTAEEKNEAFEIIAASRRFKRARRIDHDTFEYLSHWYYPAIREMAARDDFQADAGWLARRLYPRVPKQKVEKALEVLLRLGLLVEEEDGTVTLNDVSLTTGHEVAGLAVGNFHRQMLSRAAESIELVNRDKRDISGLTVCIGDDLVPEIKDRMHRFRETLMELCDGSEQSEVVYQINLQLFPLTLSSNDEDS